MRAFETCLEMRTREQIIDKCLQTHNNEYDYSLLPDSVSMSSVVPIICKKHGVFKQSLKNHINQHQGCPECSKEKRLRSQREKGLATFLKSTKDRFGGKYSYPHIDTEYDNSHSKITIHCNDCGYDFTKIACDHITSPNGGCRNCQKPSIADTYTYNELVGKSDKGVHLKVFEGAVTKTDLVTAICNIHGEYQVLASTILDGRGFCKKCSKKHDEAYIDTLARNVNDIMSGKYKDDFDFTIPRIIGISSKINLTCKRCGYTFSKCIKDVLSSATVTCRRCEAKTKGAERAKTTEEDIEQAKAVHGDLYDYTNTIYLSSSQKVEIKCKKCGRVFSIEANSHLQGHGCPYHYTNRSRDEEDILKYVKSIYDGPVYNNDRSVIGDGTELDIVIPEKGIAIEYDGLFWHNELNKPKDYHLTKTNKCQEHGIKLIHIFEDEWKNPTKRDIWKSMLRNKLGLGGTRIYARGCKIGTVSKKDGYEFLEQNHLQGKCQSSIMYGLYLNGELVSIMTFGKSRHFIGNNSHEYELLRFCNKLGCSVIGGAGRLFKHFVAEYGPKSIVSYADYRWSDGNLYDNLGFKLYNHSKPNYYYVIGYSRKNRFNYRKSVLVKKYGCPDALSEHEFCLNRKWYRIYDCGALCYEWLKQ